jgi:hypothetical protein
MPMQAESKASVALAELAERSVPAAAAHVPAQDRQVARRSRPARQPNLTIRGVVKPY